MNPFTISSVGKPAVEVLAEVLGAAGFAALAGFCCATVNVVANSETNKHRDRDMRSFLTNEQFMIWQRSGNGVHTRTPWLKSSIQEQLAAACTRRDPPCVQPALPEQGQNLAPQQSVLPD